MNAALSILALLALASPAQADPCHLPRAHQHFGGQVVRIVDGDTIVLRTADCPALHVRLADFDAPEASERPAGPIATAALVLIAQGHQTRCEVTRGRRGNFRSYGRVMATCWVGGVTLGDAMRVRGIGEGGR